MHIHARRQFALALDLPKPEVVQLALEGREVAMSEIYTHFSFEGYRIVDVQLAARPGDEVRGLVADHGQELDEEVGGRGPSAVYRAGHGVRGARPAKASPGSLLAAFFASNVVPGVNVAPRGGSASLAEHRKASISNGTRATDQCCKYRLCPSVTAHFAP